ncbi:hypothetical protein ASD80_06955 [Devosia sp. Root635]|nr:hypothetical protein ASD80_06955 [Devosia sp. Root635]
MLRVGHLPPDLVQDRVLARLTGVLSRLVVADLSSVNDSGRRTSIPSSPIEMDPLTLKIPTSPL